jgi:hypothetical protein
MFSLGEGIDADGNLMLVLAFTVDGDRTGYPLSAETAFELVKQVTEWGRGHAPSHDVE